MRNIAKTMTKGATNAQPIRLLRARASRAPDRTCSVEPARVPVATLRAAVDMFDSFRSDGVRLGELDVHAADEGVEAVRGVGLEDLGGRRVVRLWQERLVLGALHDRLERGDVPGLGPRQRAGEDVGD